SAQIPREDLRRREHIAALVPLLRPRPVLVQTPVLRAVLLGDALRRRTLHRWQAARAPFDHDRVRPGLGAHRDPRLARDVARPLRILAALEVPAIVDPPTPFPDKARFAVGG